jgi:hypothetical protein
MYGMVQPMSIPMRYIAAIAEIFVKHSFFETVYDRFSADTETIIGSSKNLLF